MNLNADEETLLKHEFEEDGSDESDIVINPPVNKWTLKKVALRFFDAFFLLGNVAFFLFTINKIVTLKSYCPELPFSPATSSLSWKHQPIDYDAPNPFAGELGTPELNRAWEELKINEIFRASEQDLRSANALNPNSLAMENGGYMGILRVYHEIHCLDWIKREWKVEKPEMMDHLDHCLVALRDGAMCKADLSVGSLYWWPEEEEKRVKRAAPDRLCVNWDSLQTWLKPKRLQFYKGVAEAPVMPNGKKVDVVLGDHLHTLQDLNDIP